MGDCTVSLRIEQDVGGCITGLWRELFWRGHQLCGAGWLVCLCQELYRGGRHIALWLELYRGDWLNGLWRSSSGETTPSASGVSRTWEAGLRTLLPLHLQPCSTWSSLWMGELVWPKGNLQTRLHFLGQGFLWWPEAPPTSRLSQWAGTTKIPAIACPPA